MSTVFSLRSKKIRPPPETGGERTREGQRSALFAEVIGQRDHQQSAEHDGEDRVGDHVGAVVEEGVEGGSKLRDAHEFLGHILGVDRNAADVVDDETGGTADERCQREQLPAAAQQTGQPYGGVGKGVVEYDGDPADGPAVGDEILQRAEGESRQNAPAHAPAYGEKDQRDHHQVDGAAKGAEGQPDGDLQIAQRQGQGDTYAALCQHQGLGFFHLIRSFQKEMHDGHSGASCRKSRSFSAFLRRHYPDQVPGSRRYHAASQPAYASTPLDLRPLL